MVKYEATPGGLRGYQVTATSPDARGLIVDDFATLIEAELFVDTMLALDAAAVLGDGNPT